MSTATPALPFQPLRHIGTSLDKFMTSYPSTIPLGRNLLEMGLREGGRMCSLKTFDSSAVGISFPLTLILGFLSYPCAEQKALVFSSVCLDEQV